MKKIVITAIASCLWIAWTDLHASAAEFTTADVRLAMGRVESILLRKGYATQGYARSAPPTVTTLPELPDRHWGEFVPGEIKISDAQPEACKPVTLVHELAHDATVKMRLIPVNLKASVRELKEEFERIAHEVEFEIASDRINCIMRRTLP